MPHLAHIRLQGLWPHAAHPVRLLGRFDARALIYAIAPDMDLEWTRQPKKSAESFDRRICQDILKARGLPMELEPVEHPTHLRVPSQKRPIEPSHPGPCKVAAE